MYMGDIPLLLGFLGGWRLPFRQSLSCWEPGKLSFEQFSPFLGGREAVFRAVLSPSRRENYAERCPSSLGRVTPALGRRRVSIVVNSCSRKENVINVGSSCSCSCLECPTIVAQRIALTNTSENVNGVDGPLWVPLCVLFFDSSHIPVTYEGRDGLFHKEPNVRRQGNPLSEVPVNNSQFLQLC